MVYFAKIVKSRRYVPPLDVWQGPEYVLESGLNLTLMPGGNKKGHTYLNKSAALTCS